MEGYQHGLISRTTGVPDIQNTLEVVDMTGSTTMADHLKVMAATTALLIENS